MGDFELFGGDLEAALKCSDRSTGGRPPSDAMQMFKVLVLKTLYMLFEDQTEHQVKDRLSFMRFLGLELSDKVPDGKTIWLYREQLARAGAIKGRRTWFETVHEMQTSLDRYLESYNTKRPHQGHGMNGRTPFKAIRDDIPSRKEKSKTINIRPHTSHRTHGVNLTPAQRRHCQAIIESVQMIINEIGCLPICTL